MRRASKQKILNGILITIVLLITSCTSQLGADAATIPSTHSLPSTSVQIPESQTMPEITPTLPPKQARQTEIALVTQTPTLPVCDNGDLVRTEYPHTVTMKSFFDEAVRKAFAEDPLTRINATYLDLETGSAKECETVDIYYQLSCGSQCFPLFHVQEGVQAVPFKEKEPTHAECFELLNNGNERNDLITKYGLYTCIRTKEGSLGWLRYDDDFWQNLPSDEVQLTYFIWDQMVDK